MILNMTGGGVGGCVLTVTAPAGATVTASKDGRTLTKTAVSGTAVFRGLESGEWSVACTDGEQTSVPQTVTVKNDYAAELTFFAATINVTYPEGSVCTASDGVTTLTAPDTSGSWSCVVPNAGTWTVSCTDGSETDSDSVSIASDGQSASVTLTYRTMIYDLGWGDTASGFERYNTGGSSDTKPITVTYENGYIVMNRTMYSWKACVYTNVDFDLTDVKTVCCKTGDIGSGSGADSGSIYFGVGKASSVNAAAKVKLTKSNTEYTLDVSALTGKYRIGFYGSTSDQDWKWTNRKIEAFWF